ncbi:MAG: DNA internalization-related competence protein ComEC/Rec2 [Marinobacter sp. 34-60-7]|nr:MAG: DNA internalization-related competence protein ComEC/Rec2 [Marinobacter sp. 34-60-7]
MSRTGIEHPAQAPTVSWPWLAMSFASGVIVLYALPALPPYFFVLIISVLPLTLALAPMSQPGLSVPRWGQRSLLLAAFAGLGLAWAAAHSGARLSQHLPGDLEGERISVQGYLCSLPQPGSFNSLRFNLCVYDWPGLSGSEHRDRLPRRLRLAWYGAREEGLPGNLLALEVVLKRPYGQVNGHGFRYEDWLFRHGIGATGSVRKVVRADHVPCDWVCAYHQAYAEVAAAVDRQFASADQLGLVASLLIGNRAHLTDDHWQILKATGTIHLVAISGLHLGLLATVLGLLARAVTVLVPAGRLSERRRRHWVLATVVVGCSAYALLAGFSVPTQRALIMVTVASGYWLLARQSSPWRPFILALFLVLLLDPLAPLDQGFWLSFGAVAILVLAFAGRLMAPGWLRGLVLAQVAIFAALWPILMWHGQSQPLAGFLANLVAIPWVSLVVMPLVFLLAPLVFVVPDGVQALIQATLDGALTVLWEWLVWVGGLEWPSLPRLPLMVLAVQGLLVLLLLRLPERRFQQWAVSALVIAWATVILGPGDVRPRVTQPVITVWDVGQGLSVLVRDGEQVVVYDTGPGVPGVFSAAESVLLPGLGGRGLNTIDLLVLSHADSDHAGGLDVLAPALDLRRVVSGEPLEAATAFPSSRPVEPCPSEPVLLERLELHFWHSSETSSESGNDASCVMVIKDTASGSQVWLPGDISRSVEAEMLAAREGLLSMPGDGHRIVIAPHHGSKTSSSVEWVNALGPEAVIYTAGYRHRYGHPHPDVVARYHAAGSRALSTACSGELNLRFGPERVRITEARASAPFWIHRPGPVRDLCKIP